jgi:hypothetical protein
VALSPTLATQPASEPFSVAALFLELNDTDGDLGLHAEIDADAWTSLEIEDPGERMLLGIASRNRLSRQGLTQLAFESAEPSFDELDPVDFFKRFPEGVYEIEARAKDGGRFESHVTLSHVLAAPVEPTVDGLPAAESCDEPVLPVVAAPVILDWEPVTSSHPDIGVTPPVLVTISRYQVFLEQGALKLGLDLPPSVTEFEIPESLTTAGGTFKYEIVARTSTGNNTAIESCFVIP